MTRGNRSTLSASVGALLAPDMLGLAYVTGMSLDGRIKRTDFMLFSFCISLAKEQDLGSMERMYQTPRYDLKAGFGVVPPPSLQDGVTGAPGGQISCAQDVQQVSNQYHKIFSLANQKRYLDSQ